MSAATVVAPRLPRVARSGTRRLRSPGGPHRRADPVLRQDHRVDRRRVVRYTAELLRLIAQMSLGTGAWR